VTLNTVKAQEQNTSLNCHAKRSRSTSLNKTLTCHAERPPMERAGSRIARTKHQTVMLSPVEALPKIELAWCYAERPPMERAGSRSARTKHQTVMLSAVEALIRLEHYTM